MTLEGADAREAARQGKPLIAWRDEWNLGIPGMDRDHRVLVSLINQIPAAFGGQEERIIVSSVLNGLWDYTDYHFAREEAVLEAAGYAHEADHHAKHGTLKEQVRDYVRAYADDPDSVDPEELLSFMERWLINHILVEDMRYVEAVRHSPGSEEAAERIKLVDDEDLGDILSQMDR